MAYTHQDTSNAELVLPARARELSLHRQPSSNNLLVVSRRLFQSARGVILDSASRGLQPALFCFSKPVDSYRAASAAM